MPLEATPQGLVAQVPKPMPHSLPQPLFPLLSPSPLADGRPVFVLKRRIHVNATSPGPIGTPMTSGMVQRGTRPAIRDKPRDRCAAAGADGDA